MFCFLVHFLCLRFFDWRFLITHLRYCFLISSVYWLVHWCWTEHESLVQHVRKKRFEYNKRVIRSHISKKDKQYIGPNGQKKKDNRTNNDLQSSTQKTKDWATRTPLKTGGERRCFGRVNSSCSTCCIRCVTLCYKPDDKS